MMKHSLLTKLAVLALLYPWLVSFGIPHDSLTHKVTVAGGAGQYDVVSRDCSGRILSVSEVPFSEAAATVEGELASGVGYKLRGGYMNAANGKHLFSQHWTYDSNGSTHNHQAHDGVYGGVTLRLASNYFGLDLTALAADKNVEFSELGNNLAVGGGLRMGYLDAWYWTFNLLTDDPIVSRTWGSTGFGFALNSKESEKLHILPPTLWLGIGAGVYDGPMLLTKLSYPFNREWSGDFSGTISLASNFEGALSAGVAYSW